MDGMPPETIGMQRARGVVDLHVSNGSITRFYQSGAAKALWPKTYGSMAEAVIVNTAGGVTGGDIFSYNATLENSALALTTQAAERAYKSRAYPAQMSVKLIARNHAALHWLPQETILFDGCHLNRKIDVDIDTTSECLMFEALTFGRHAMKEVLSDCLFSDQWRVRCDGELVHAEALRMTGPIHAMLQHVAGGAGAELSASFLYIGPRLAQVEAQLKTVLDRLSSRVALSVWQGRLVVRMLAPDALYGRKDIAMIIDAMREHSLPRVWQ